MPIKTIKKVFCLQKYVYQGAPYNAYKNTRQNNFNEINKDNNQKWQNRASEIRLSGVPPIMPIKTKINIF